MSLRPRTGAGRRPRMVKPQRHEMPALHGGEPRTSVYCAGGVGTLSCSLISPRVLVAISAPTGLGRNLGLRGGTLTRGKPTAARTQLIRLQKWYPRSVPALPKRFRLLVFRAATSQAARWSSLRPRQKPGIEAMKARRRRWAGVARFLGTGTLRMTKPWRVITLTEFPRLPDWGTSCAFIGECRLRLQFGGPAPR